MGWNRVDDLDVINGKQEQLEGVANLSSHILQRLLVPRLTRQQASAGASGDRRHLPPAKAQSCTSWSLRLK
jgi:hypothetical protein